ncbi:MAG: hypothetical protein JWM21_3272 [Acidobacteria bacterium]|nr:hypothetical protein [Acidobacteriota bacterium]
MKVLVSRIAAAATFLVCSVISSSAQTTANAQRKPSEAIRPFVVLSGQSLDELKQKLRPDNKVEDLIGGAGMQLRVAIQHEKNKSGSAAELHDASDDVYYVMEGSATLILGGKLDAPKEVEPGEWRSPHIIDGRTIDINKGDLVIVPRGTPHQRSTTEKDFTMILIKVYLEPLRPTPPKPAAETKEQKQ